MTQMRKEKGISQKDAAAGLGISQALLSHYEKGVRECGLDFIVRAAAYYGVTTDYVLGVQASKYGFVQNFLDYDDETLYDGPLDMKTVLRCGAYISEEYSVIDTRYGDKLKWIYAISQYKVVVASLLAGKTNLKWLGTTCRYDDVLFGQFTDTVMNYLLSNSENTVSPAQNEGKVAPAFIKKLVESCEEYVTAVAKGISEPDASVQHK